MIKFIKKNKLKYFCECKESPSIFLMNKIYDYLYFSEEKNIKINELYCNIHNDEKYIFYCEKCKKNLCNNCVENCLEHENKIKVLTDKNAIKKCNYISNKINEEEKNYNDKNEKSLDFGNEHIHCKKLVKKKNKVNTNTNSSFNNNENVKSNEDSFFIIEDEEDNISFINTKEEKEEFINIINTDNIEKNNPKNIFTIIFDDYKNYPNFNHIKTISNLEKYFIFYYSDYNELNLKYKFEEEDIKDNSIELFGEIFVNNNKDNCFLIINENIFDLCRFIHLYEIFDNQDNIDKPLQLDVKLIEPKNNLIIDASFMFNGISTLQSNSNFLHFNSKNITKMS